MRIPSLPSFLVAIAISFSASQLFAADPGTTILNFNVGVIRDSNMNPVIADSSSFANDGVIGVLVADTSGAGFSQGNSLLGSTLSVGQNLGNSNDVIVAVFHAKLISSTPPNPADPQYDTQFSEQNENAIDVSAYAVGTKLALYWFPSITLAGTTLSTQNLASLSVANQYFYGYYRNDAVDSASYSDIGYVVPAAGSWLLYTWDKVVMGDNTALASQSNLSALSFISIPEPSSVALLGGGLLAMGAWVRRRKVA